MLAPESMPTLTQSISSPSPFGTYANLGTMGTRTLTTPAAWRTAVGQPLLGLAYLTHSLHLRESEDLDSADHDDYDDEVAADELIRVRFLPRILDPEAQFCAPPELGVAALAQGRSCLEGQEGLDQAAVQALCQKPEVSGPAKTWWEAMILGSGMRSRPPLCTSSERWWGRGKRLGHRGQP